MTSAPIDLVLSRLENPKSAGKDCWKARCPAAGHEDRHPSMTVRVVSDGTVLLKCHSRNCPPDAIVAGMNLTMHDLFPPSGNGNGDDWTPAGPAIASYPYTDAQGRHVFSVARTADKQFPGWHPDPAKKSGKNWHLAGFVDPVLYHLPRLIAGVQEGATIFVVDGERDVHAIERAGGVATTVPHWAGEWPTHPEYSEYLRGADVVAVADKDKDGKGGRQAAGVAAALQEIAASVQIVEAAEGKDSADHLAAGHGLEEFVVVDASELQAEHDDATEADSAERLHRTDTGNASRVLAYCGERVRYCAMDKAWYIFDGIRWAEDKTLHIEHLAGEALRGIYAEAAEEPDPDQRKKLGAWAVASEAGVRLREAVLRARSDRRCAVLPEVFDRDPYALNCLSGTIDLRTGKLRRHDSADMISMVAPVTYDPQARSELWDKVLLEACHGDAEYVAYLQRFYGYAASGHNSEEIIAIQAGPTLTAKTTVNEAIKAALGDYAATIDPETLTRQKYGGSATRNDVLQLNAKRLAVSAEATRGAEFDVSFLKAFAGEYTMKKRALYRPDQEFHPTAQLVLHTNDIPELPDDDDAIWRRVHVQPFTHQPEHIDVTFKATLRDVGVSGPAILAWLVQGYRDWQERGLDEPLVVRQASAALRISMNPMHDFYAQCCIFEPGAFSTSAALQTVYKQWADANGILPKSRVGYKARAASLRRQGASDEGAAGFGVVDGKKVRGWTGVRLVDAAQGSLL